MVLQVVTARQYDPIFIIPIIFNIHINPLQKFTQCVIWLKNKISQPTTRDLPLGGAGLGDYWSKAEIVGKTRPYKPWWGRYILSRKICPARIWA
ncbi:MAG: hypothetical protein EAZ78_24785 [Oscillatoriales cyanobacterium]|nr:MAG: hypothetical protein EAZ78_24785 [Oscillatoriales cyanobacterium]